MRAAIFAAFVLILAAPVAPLDYVAPWQIVSAVGAYLAMSAVLAAGGAILSGARLRQAGRADARAMKWFAAASLLQQVWLVAGLGGLMWLGLGRELSTGTDPGPLRLAHTVCLLLPFTAALLLTWLLYYPFYVRLRNSTEPLPQSPRRCWTLGEYLEYSFRHNFLTIAGPLLLILLLTDLGWLAVRRLVSPENAQLAASGLAAGCGVAVFLVSPVLICRLWRTGPLSDPQLVEELQQLSRRLRMRCRGIRVWHTGGLIVNALAMGLLRPLRYVMLSDAMLANMDRRSVKAVFAHEAGHIVSRHIFYLALFSLSVILLSGALGGAIAERHWLPDWGAEVVTVAAMVAGWGLGFGWISRRFERQSDVIAAWACSRDVPDAPLVDDPDAITPEGAAVFSWALQQVAHLNALPQEKWNYRHGSIASRVAYVLWLGNSGLTRRPIDRTVRRIKLGCWLLLAAGIVAVVVQP